MPHQYTLRDYVHSDGGLKVFGRAAAELPSAAADFAQEAWDNPARTLCHATKTVLEAGAMGVGIGYLVPARGPASIILGTALTAPLVFSAGSRMNRAYNESLSPFADQDAIARSLAYDTVSGTWDLGLSLGGGYAGAELGYALAGRGGFVGKIGQKTQRAIMNAENASLAVGRYMADTIAARTSRSAMSKMPKIDIYNNVPNGSQSSNVFSTRVDTAVSTPVSKTSIAPEYLPFGQRTLGILNRRLNQYLEPGGDYSLYMGSLHGHSRYSDGMGLPKDIFAKAHEQGYDFTAITDHNHPAARGGVKPDDVRAKDQAGTPTVAEDPILYSQTFADAAATEVPGEFIPLVGLEIGTIGSRRGGHQDLLGPDPPETSGIFSRMFGWRNKVDRIAPQPQPEITLPGIKNDLPTANPGPGPVGKLPGETAPTPSARRGKDGELNLPEIEIAEAAHGKHLGGVNHINIFEVPTFLESVRVPRSRTDQFIRNATGRDAGPIVKEPDVVKINDGDFRALADHLDNLKDSTGGTPVIQLNHPRFKADESPNLPASERGRDFGQKSFKSRKEWLNRFVDPYVRQIEVIKGGALSPEPVDVVAPHHLDPTSYAGYLDKGVHASPTFGRDFHYGDPGGNPGATGIMAKSLDKPTLMDALRERRTIATTNGEKLTATMWGNDKHPMGSILDQAVAPELTLSTKIGGEVVPEASYKVKLMGDTKVGDKKLAEVLQEQTMTGEELLAADCTVKFDPVEHTMGKKSAYYMEIHRTDPVTGHTDKMWTAPIWVEPLTGEKHSIFMRLLTGETGQTIEKFALPQK